MATVSGVWKWNNPVYIGSSDNFTQSVNFISNGVSYSSISAGFVFSSDNPTIEKYDVYLEYDSTRLISVTHSYAMDYFSSVPEQYELMDFGATEQTVSDTFYTYLTANAVEQTAPSVPTPDWANCFVKTASGNKAVEKVWLKQNGELVQIFGEQSIAKNYAFQWNSSSSNWWNNYLHLVLNGADYNKPPKTFPDLTSGVTTPIKVWDEDDESSPGQGRFALYDSSGQLITPIEFVGTNCDSEGYFNLPEYLGEINGTLTPPYYENGVTVIFEYK